MRSVLPTTPSVGIWAGPGLDLRRLTACARRLRVPTDGLAGYVYAKDTETAAKIGKKIRAGMLHLNGAGIDPSVPFGGFKTSGNGREWGQEGIMEFLEVKSLLNANAKL